MDGKGVYTLRSLPMGASGLLWSMFISMPSAMILLWAAQLLAIYLGYGLYRMEVLLYNLPGNVDGMSRIGFSIIVPDREWLPPANDLYLAFIRTPFLQLFYPRHPVFLALAAFMVVLPPISGAYSVLALCERRARALLPVLFCWGAFLIGLVEGQADAEPSDEYATLRRCDIVNLENGTVVKQFQDSSPLARMGVMDALYADDTLYLISFITPPDRSSEKEQNQQPSGWTVTCPYLSVYREGDQVFACTIQSGQQEDKRCETPNIRRYEALQLQKGGE